MVKKAAKDYFIDSMEWLVDHYYISSNFAGGLATKTETLSFKGDRNAHHVLTVEVFRTL